MRLEFDWDPAKAKRNQVKHGVAFENAMSVFADPLALSRSDETEIQKSLAAQAAAQGISLNALVNALLRKDIERIEAVE